jgi:predicted GNAT family acetyltransferase
MKPTGFTEVSGVCTHPEHRGRGYAGALTRVVAGRILARGETPFLHAYPSNTGAIALYQTLGFAIRREMNMTVLTRA